jgi:hypothetical protein
MLRKKKKKRNKVDKSSELQIKKTKRKSPPRKDSFSIHGKSAVPHEASAK